MTERSLSPVLEAEIIETGKKVATIHANFADFLRRQTHVENKLDDHDGRIHTLEKARHGDRRFIGALTLILSPLFAAAVAFGKSYFGF